MVNFTNWKGELEIFEEKVTDFENEPEIFTVAYTLAGLSILINPEYELKESNVLHGAFVVEKKKSGRSSSGS